MVKAQHIEKSLSGLPVLKGINLQVNAGEMVAITGPSGAGKTTLLHIIGTLDSPDAGQLYIAGKQVGALKDTQISAFRNKYLGFVFQFHHLLPEFTALENIALPALIAGKSHNEANDMARVLLSELGLYDRAEHKPSQLSGGEQQRVAVARALINKPSVVLADEPSGNLDTKNAAFLHDLFFKIRDTLGQTFILVTHNQELATRADRCLQMRDGVFV